MALGCANLAMDTTGAGEAQSVMGEGTPCLEEFGCVSSAKVILGI